MRLVETVTLAAGDLSVEVIPSRGLDLGEARLGGERFSWESPLGHIPWQGDFSRSFGGGLLVTCGLRNVGAPSEGQPQHGWHSSLPARDVVVERAAAGGRIVDANVPGPTLELTREIMLADNTVRVSDVVRNAGPFAEPAPLLYHVNVLWDSIDIDSDKVVARDTDAASGSWHALGPPGPERVYEETYRRHARGGRLRRHPRHGALEPAPPLAMDRAVVRRAGDRAGELLRPRSRLRSRRRQAARARSGRDAHQHARDHD